MDAIYLINWAELIELLLPFSQRKQIFKSWMTALFAPLIFLHSSFMAYRREALYKLSHDSRVGLLEKMLNDKFDQNPRRIYIENAIIKEPVWFFEPEADKPVWFYDDIPVHFYEESDFVGDGVDFTVFVPASLRPSSQQAEEAFIIRMEGQINYYKLYSKNYRIVWIS